jgi:hypothetical protein
MEGFFTLVSFRADFDIMFTQTEIVHENDRAKGIFSLGEVFTSYVQCLIGPVPEQECQARR